MRRATIEIEYIDNSLKVIAKDSYVTERLISIMEKLSKSKLKDNISSICLGYCDNYQADILYRIKHKPLLNP